mmetsp:Transcript_61091/g.132414  ORF Transcript_61091/g.132414 Transcript_61091/m.132414 type:complete len:134 (+) Transcript_61091:101-502(+)
MMHIGDVKAKQIKERMDQHKPSNILELGTYMGYSSLFFKHASMGYTDNARVTTVDVNTKFMGLARLVHHHALWKDCSMLLGPLDKCLDAVIANGPYDMIFLDHEETIYKQDLLILEKAGLLKKNCMVVADNVE